MSSQRGNVQRTRTQKHKNTKGFKNDLYDTSHITKKINNLEFYGICNRCKGIIDWKVKFKKYKTLTTAKKCVKCLEKKVKDAYYIVCFDCCNEHKICSKCAKPCEELEFGETEAEKRRKENEFQNELKMLSERKRRKFLRLLEKGFFTKENLVENPEKFRNEEDSDDDDEFDDDDDCDQDGDEEKDTEDSQGDENDVEDLDDEDDDDLDEDGDEDEYETLDEDEEEENPKPIKSVESKKK